MLQAATCAARLLLRMDGGIVAVPRAYVGVDVARQHDGVVDLVALQVGQHIAAALAVACNMKVSGLGVHHASCEHCRCHRKVFI